MKVIKYGAKWCSPCKDLEMFLNFLKISYTSVDTDENPEVLEERHTNTIPFLDICDDSGKLLGTIRGCPDSSSDLLEKINKILAKNE